jgi:hypothetical protein
MSRHCRLLCVFALAALGGAATLSAANGGLLGATISWQYYFDGGAWQSPGRFEVNGGAGGKFEKTGTSYFVILADNNSITFNYSIEQGDGPWSSSALSLAPTIHNGIAINMVSGPAFSTVTIDPATNMAGFDASRISFTDDQIQVDWQNLAFNPHTIVKLDVNKASAGAEWISLAPTGTPPAPRAGASAVYSTAAHQMIVFGGNTAGCSSSTASLNDTWVLAGANGLAGTPAWSQISFSSSSPPGREGHTAVYNSTADRMVVFGGDAFGCTASKLNDLWVLVNASGAAGTPSWQMLTPLGIVPPARSDHTAVYDPSTDQMIVFGGIGTALDNLSDLWPLANASGAGGTPQWTNLIPSGTGPADTAYMAGSYDIPTNEMTLYSGWSVSGSSSNQVWLLSNANGSGGTPQWSVLTPTGAPPAAVTGPRGVYSQASKNAIYFGGSETNAVWTLKDADGVGAAAWVQVSPAGPTPSGRGGLGAEPTMVADPVSTRSIVFGGAGVSGALNDTWILSP